MLKGVELPRLPRVDTGGFQFSSSPKVSSRSRIPSDLGWREWLETAFPSYVSRGFGKHHEDFWNWVWRIGPDTDPEPFLAVWSRGGGKSSSAELAAASLGIRGQRRYVLYVRDTQERADDSVSNVAALLEAAGVERDVDRYGNSKGWRRNRVRASGGFTVDALGLDVAGRGVKLEDTRPDVIIFDDIDARHDSTKVTDKKQATITDSLLPAGTDNVAVVFIQNLIISDGVVSRLVENRADYLTGRIVSGPHPAVEDLEIEEEAQPDGMTRHVIIGGRATWAGQDLAACQRLLDRIGLRSFMRECQHRTRDPEEAVFKREWWAGKNRYDPDDKRLVNKCIGRWIVWDTAHKEGEGRAFSAGVVGELLPDYRLVIRYVTQDRKTYDALPGYVQSECEPFVADRKLRAVVIEDAASGQDLIPDLRKSGEPWIRAKVKGETPRRGGKEAAWDAAALHCSRGMILLPEPSGSVKWKHDFEEQIFDVKNAEYKDMADAFALLINYLESEHRVFSQRWDAMLAQAA